MANGLKQQQRSNGVFGRKKFDRRKSRDFIGVKVKGQQGLFPKKDLSRGSKVVGCARGPQHPFSSSVVRAGHVTFNESRGLYNSPSALPSSLGQGRFGKKKIWAPSHQPRCPGPPWLFWRSFKPSHAAVKESYAPRASASASPAQKLVSGGSSLVPTPKVIFPPMVTQATLLLKDKVMFGDWGLGPSGSADAAVGLSGGLRVAPSLVGCDEGGLAVGCPSSSDVAREGEMGADGPPAFFELDEGDASLLSVGNSGIFEEVVPETPAAVLNKEVELIKAIMPNDDRQPQQVLDSLGFKLVSHNGGVVELCVDSGLKVYSRRRGKDWKRDLVHLHSSAYYDFSGGQGERGHLDDP